MTQEATVASTLLQVMGRTLLSLNADDIKNVDVRRLRLSANRRALIANMEMCGRVAQRKFGKLIFLMSALRGPASLDQFYIH